MPLNEGVKILEMDHLLGLQGCSKTGNEILEASEVCSRSSSH